MEATMIVHRTSDMLYQNLVLHECSCGEFLLDIAKECREFGMRRDNTKECGVVTRGISKVDLFWHLDEYCEKKYGPCYWQLVTITSLVEETSGHYVRCSQCGKRVSNVVDKELTVRAWIECPECNIAKGQES